MKAAFLQQQSEPVARSFGTEGSTHAMGQKKGCSFEGSHRSLLNTLYQTVRLGITGGSVEAQTLHPLITGGRPRPVSAKQSRVRRRGQRRTVNGGENGKEMEGKRWRKTGKVGKRRIGGREEKRKRERGRGG